MGKSSQGASQLMPVCIPPELSPVIVALHVVQTICIFMQNFWKEQSGQGCFQTRGSSRVFQSGQGERRYIGAFKTVENIEQSIIIPMDSNQSRRPRKYERVVRQPKYSFISLEKRVQLIELVAQQNMSIYQASRLLGINNATAKDIIRKYKKNGTVFIRKAEAQQLSHNRSGEPSQCSEAPQAKVDEITEKDIPKSPQPEQNLRMTAEALQFQPFMMPLFSGMMLYYWS